MWKFPRAGGEGGPGQKDAARIHQSGGSTRKQPPERRGLELEAIKAPDKAAAVFYSVILE